MLPAKPAETIPNSVRSPSETLKPANSIIASLGTGMQALLEQHQHENTGQPASPMKSVAALTIG